MSDDSALESLKHEIKTLKVVCSILSVGIIFVIAQDFYSSRSNSVSPSQFSEIVSDIDGQSLLDVDIIRASSFIVVDPNNSAVAELGYGMGTREIGPGLTILDDQTRKPRIELFRESLSHRSKFLLNDSTGKPTHTILANPNSGLGVAAFTNLTRNKSALD